MAATVVIIHNGKFYKGNEITEQFMNHLKSCFVTSSTVISSNFDIASQQIGNIHRQHYTDQFLDFWANFENRITQAQVEQAIYELDDKKDPGPMTITSQFLKYNTQIISPVLTDIFNSILRTSVIPAEWKTSFIAPIPKKGAINNISNYRGIAMQFVIPKIFDKILTGMLQRTLVLLYHINNMVWCLIREQHLTY